MNRTEHKEYNQGTWATREQLQETADSLGWTVDEVIEKLQSMFSMVGDRCNGQ